MFLVNLMRVGAYIQGAGGLYLGCLLGYIFGWVYIGGSLYTWGTGEGHINCINGISIKN